jgi:siroheme synthase-like protein
MSTQVLTGPAPHIVTTEQAGNRLFPVFLKLEQLQLLVVGGGAVALEKLNAVLYNAPGTSITVVATEASEGMKALVKHRDHIRLYERPFQSTDLEAADLVLVAVNDLDEAGRISNEARRYGKLVNAADKPELCDFYLGSVVQKGDLKIGISTNGKSPTIAKRLKEVLNEALPQELDAVLQQMPQIRDGLKGDFAAKVNRLNQLTSVLVAGGTPKHQLAEQRWKRVATWCVFAFFFMFAGHAVLSLIPMRDLLLAAGNWVAGLDQQFYLMVLAGFMAQLVDGLLGMGYGVTCASVLMSIGAPLPAISGSIHTAEMFSSGVSGYSHYRFGNVNRKLLRAILIPGVIGAILGALLLAEFGESYARFLRPLLAAYTLFLGVKILVTAFGRKKAGRKVKHVGWLAGAGGFLDSFGGGGWGPLVTSTLISRGKTPRYVIGTISVTEFFVTMASALAFFTMLGISHWQVILGLIIGGVTAAPISARLAGKLPVKTMFIGVGTLVILSSLRILFMAFF